MMKRVGLSKFSPLEVSRKVQQCLRFEGVNANGVATSNCTDVRGQRDSVPHGDAILTDHSHEDGSNKTNLLTTIKRKLRKTKRGKRCDVRSRSDSLSNVCQCHSENCELHSCCPKHYRTRKHKPGDKCSVWPIAASILRCQNHQQPDKKNDDVAELLPEEPCSCYGAPSEKVNCILDKQGSCSKLPAQASCSLSSLSCDVDPAASSLPLQVESDGDSSRAAYSSIDADVPVAIYARTVCSLADTAKKILSPDLSAPRVGNLTQELYKLSKYGWYWGPINRSEAESKLVDQPDGAFLVRDSSDDRYILSLSFRSYGKTLHTRIEHSSGLFSFYAQPEPEGHASIVELIQQSMCYSQSGVFCYSRSRSPGSPSFPVRLTKPISRFTQVRSLQYLCRFVIRQYTRYDHIQQLPLPPRIKGYLEEGHY